MILNPPHIVFLLRAIVGLQRHGFTGEPLHQAVAKAFVIFLGRPSWAEFKATYHLYLQSIPFETARAAWGLTQTQPTPDQQP